TGAGRYATDGRLDAGARALEGTRPDATGGRPGRYRPARCDGGRIGLPHRRDPARRWRPEPHIKKGRPKAPEGEGFRWNCATRSATRFVAAAARTFHAALARFGALGEFFPLLRR